MKTRSTPTGAGPSGEIVQVFEAESRDLPDFRYYLDDLTRRRTFITELATAQIRGQRTSTFLGEMWSLVDPLFQAAIYYFLFVVIRGGSGGANRTSYITAIIGSVFLFNYTRIAMTEGGRSILRNKGLVLNSIFPRALLPVAETYKGLLLTLPALVIYAVAHVALRAPITGALLLLPLLFVIQSTLNLGLALLLSTATVLYKDMSNYLNYIVRLLNFATPVVYPVSTLSPSVRNILQWNPLFPLFVAYQSVITGQTPAPSQIFQCAAWAGVFLFAGAWVFIRNERSFALHL